MAEEGKIFPSTLDGYSRMFRTFVGDLQHHAGRLKLSSNIMDFTLTSTTLTSKLVALSRVVCSKKSLPALEGFLFAGVGNLRLERKSSANGFAATIEETEREVANNGKGTGEKNEQVPTE